MNLFPIKMFSKYSHGKAFECTLREESYIKMLNYCHKYSNAINAKCEPFSTEALLMT